MYHYGYSFSKISRDTRLQTSAKLFCEGVTVFPSLFSTLTQTRQSNLTWTLLCNFNKFRSLKQPLTLVWGDKYVQKFTGFFSYFLSLFSEMASIDSD